MKKIIVSIFIVLLIATSIFAKPYDDAVALYDEGKNTEAIAVLEGVLDKNPDDYKVLVLVGYIYEEINEYEKAIDYYERAMNIKTESEIINKAANLRRLMKGESVKVGGEEIPELKFPYMKVGISAALNVCQLYIDGEYGGNTFPPSYAFSNFNFLRINNILGIEFGLTFSRMEARTIRNDDFAFIIEEEHVNEYFMIELPFILDIYIPSLDFTPIISAGFNLGGTVYYKETTRIKYSDDTYIQTTNESYTSWFDKVSMSPMIGVGILKNVGSGQVLTRLATSYGFHRGSFFTYQLQVTFLF